MTPGEAARRDADREARLAAQTIFDRPLVLEAGAGTGKTSVLVARVVAWSLGLGWDRAEGALRGRGAAADGDRIAARVLERITAITFTEAAAAEMEERIGVAFHALASEAALPRGIEGDALPAPALWRPRARALLGSFDRLHVSTIHAWCRHLLAEHPIEAGVHPAFVVDAAGLERAVAAREAVEAWLVEAGGREDPELVELLASGVAAPELEQMLISLLAEAVPASEFGADPLAPERIAAFVGRLRAAVQRFMLAEGGRLAGLAGAAKGRDVAVAAGRTRDRLQAAAPRDVASLAELLHEIGDLWEGALDRLQAYARGTWKAVGERDAAAEHRAAISEAAAELEPMLRQLPSLEPGRLARIHGVLSPLLARAQERLRREGSESFEALLRRTQALLERHPDVTAHIRAGIDQLVVDEFQDTDPAQCAVVEQLALDEHGGEEGPGLFLVGDPKQSIYGWRNADLAAYQAFRDRIEKAGGALRRLCVNHRSSKALLDEVARVMTGAMREERGLQPAFEDLLADPELANGQGTAAPAVEYWVSSDVDASAGALTKTLSRAATGREAVQLARDLLRLAEEGGDAWRWDDVGILLRGMADADVYLEALRRAEIPYTVGRDRSYAQRREVIEASALVRAVLDPSDQIALVATLRSAWVGVPDAAWRPLWAAAFPDAVRAALDGSPGAREPLVRAVSAAAGEVRGLEIPGLERLEGWDASLLHALDVLVALRRCFERDPAERLVERLRTLPLLDAVEGARFLGPWRVANLDRFFRELGASLEQSRGDPAPVLRALRRDAARETDWDEGRAQHPSEDAVRVMTVHAAKGLQFDHVYLLQLHKGSAGSGPGPFCRGRNALAGEWRLEAGRVTASTLGFDEVETQRQRVEEAERVRTLYVAMTRARRRLVLAGSWTSVRGGAHAELLEQARPDGAAEALKRALEAESAVVDADGARWVFPALVPPAEGAIRARRASVGIDADRIRADLDALLEERREADLRAARPFGGPASDAVAEELRESVAELERGETPHGLAIPEDAEIAAAVGTALHALLERFDWEAERGAELARQRARVSEMLERRLAPFLLARARRRADRVLGRLVAGPLWERLQEISPHVVGRELAVLIGRDGESSGPVAYSAGAIDLLYRDPKTSALVVADFKTDEIEDESTLAEHAERYRAQGRAYCKAIEEAMQADPPPRFELWFLDPGRIVELDAKRSGGSAAIDARSRAD